MPAIDGMIVIDTKTFASRINWITRSIYNNEETPVKFCRKFSRSFELYGKCRKMQQEF